MRVMNVPAALRFAAGASSNPPGGSKKPGKPPAAEEEEGPPLGTEEHTRWVLRKAGYSDESIERSLAEARRRAQTPYYD